MPGCDEPTRTKGEEEYPDSDVTASNGEPFRVSSFGAKFCSTEHELKYEHLKADAEDARRSEERESINRNDYPEYDGPPY
jgi:hypothetical protein